MLISTRGQYALRVMIDLAQNRGEDPVALRLIAERQQLSMKYTESIVAILVKAGLVEGTRGKGGGYRLTRKPKEYPIGEILRLTEGTLSPVSHLEEAEGGESTGAALSRPLWKQLDSVIEEYLDHVTLRDVLRGRTGGARK